MASPTQWTWVCVNSGSYWWTGRPGVLQSVRLQSRTQLSDWTELNWQLSELTQDWGNRLLEGTDKTLCTPGPRSKEQWPHKRLLQTCSWVSRSLQQRRRSAGSGTLNSVLPSWDLLKDVSIIFITSTIVWPRVKQQGGSTAPPINRKLD